MNQILEHEFRLHCEIIDGTKGSRNERRQLKSDLRKLYEKGLRLPSSQLSPEHRWNLCSARLRDGDFTNWDGWEFRSDWAMTFRWGEKRPKIPLWDGSPKSHIVIGGEQGIGDEILFLSALPDFMVRFGKKCIEFQTYPRLKKIVERSYGIRCTDRKPLNEITEGEGFIGLGDLFPWYRRDVSHFPKKPYLKPDPEKVERWKTWVNQFGLEPKIGLGWYSRHGFLEPEDLMTEGTYFDLQYDHEKSPKAPKGVIRPPFDVKDDFENLFAFVSVLDRVQTCTQTLVHVAGSIGKECHAIIPPNNGEVNWHLWYHHGGTGLKSWSHLVYPNVTVYESIDEFRNLRS